MAPVMLFPTDPLRPRRPDEHVAPEAAAARRLGHEIGLVDLEALDVGDRLGAVAGVRGPATDVAHRGWMVDTARYDDLAAALADRDIHLRTGADAYRRAHELPGWYEALRELMPDTVWTTGDDRDGFDVGRWRVVELGDGQVGDRPISLDPDEFVAAVAPV